MVSHTEQKYTNPWIIVLRALTYANPGHGQSDRTAVLPSHGLVFYVP
jgi:hypothetical protein